MRKADCTPEQWEKYKAKAREWRRTHLETQRAQKRAYHARPEVIEKRRAEQTTPEYRAKARAQAAKNNGHAVRYQKLRADPEKWAAQIALVRKIRTGFDPELIAALLVHQDNKCAVCQRDFEGRQIRADHCHDSNTPRGLLCHHCNIIEGMMRGMKLSPEEFGARLARYLNHPPVLDLQP